MKLLFSKKNSVGRRSLDGINISKTGLSVNGDAVKRLFDLNSDNYGSLGVNEEGNICLYLSNKNHPDLLKFSPGVKNELNQRLSLNTQEAKKAIKPYIGVYSIKYVGMINNGIKEVILKSE